MLALVALGFGQTKTGFEVADVFDSGLLA